ETHDVQTVMRLQRPHTECQGTLRLRDRIALHGARAVEQEEHLIATARDAERLRMECHHRTERAVCLARHVCYRLVDILRPHEEYEIAVQRDLLTGQRHGGAVRMR